MSTSDRRYPELGMSFYVLFVIVTGWWIAGGYTDMWAHAHIPELESFFTPWHGVFYSGFGATASLFVGTAILNHRKGYPWRYSLPRVYLVSLLGIGAFFLGGLSDMIWHIFFGIEKDLAIIISPPHILVAVSAMTVNMSVCRIIWSQDGRPQETPAFILVLLLSYMTLAFNYMTDYFNPFAFPYMMKGFASSRLFTPQLGEVPITPQLSEILGFSNIVLFTSFFMGIILVSLRHWRPPFGAFTVVFTLNVTAITIAYGRFYWFVLDAAITGFVADVMCRYVVARYRERHLGLRIFGFCVPLILFTAYALTIVATDATLWTKEMWGGTILISGCVGFLLTYVMFPPLIETPEVVGDDDARRSGRSLERIAG